MISHYYHCKRHKPDKRARKIYHEVYNDRLTFEEFLLSPQMRNHQSEFLFGTSISDYKFIGLTERYTESLKILRILFPELIHIAEMYMNQNHENTLNNQYTFDHTILEKFKNLNSKDYKLYRDAHSRYDQIKKSLKII